MSVAGFSVEKKPRRALCGGQRVFGCRTSQGGTEVGLQGESVLAVDSAVPSGPPSGRRTNHWARDTSPLGSMAWRKSVLVFKERIELFCNTNISYLK